MRLGLIVAIGYLFGNILSAVIVSRLFGLKDVRKLGSGNAGATNVTTEHGTKYGIMVAAVDILKAFIPVIIGRLVFNLTADEAYILGAAVVLGHIYPVLFGFKGGKGIASLIGAALGINPLLGLALSLALVAITIATDYIAIGSMTLYLIFFLYTMMNYKSPYIFMLGAVLLLVGIYKHIPNVERIIRKEEKGLRKVLKDKKGA